MEIQAEKNTRGRTLKKHPNKYHHGDLKPALVASGLALLEQRGLDELSLRAIAADVGVSHTAPKNHFKGLRGLLSAIAAVGFRRLGEAMANAASTAQPGKARLKAATAGYVTFALANPALYQLMFSGAHCDPEDAELMDAKHQGLSTLRSVAKGLEWDKADAPGNPDRTEWMLWSTLHGYASLLIEGMIARGPTGRPPFEVAGLMPDFDYVAHRMDMPTATPIDIVARFRGH